MDGDGRGTDGRERGGERGHLGYIKFWGRDDQQEFGYSLRTCLYRPHKKRINGLAVHQHNGQYLVVSVGEDRRFRVYRSHAKHDKEGKLVDSWRVIGESGYSEEKCRSVEFRGEQFVIGYGPILCVYDIQSVVSARGRSIRPLAEVICGEPRNYITDTLWIGESRVVVATNRSLVMVDLAEKRAVYSWDVDVQGMSFDRQVDQVAAVVRQPTEKRIWLMGFSASDLTVSFRMPVDGERTACTAAFMPMAGKSGSIEQVLVVLSGSMELLVFSSSDSIERPSDDFEALPVKDSVKPVTLSRNVAAQPLSASTARRGADDYLLRLTPSHLLPPMADIFRMFMSSRV